ncbi:MAG TPA: PAS domain S-box protein, partial [Burkholderiaceae bacterium]
MPTPLRELLKRPLVGLYRRSIYGTLVMMVMASMLIPAVLGAYLVIGMRDEHVARGELAHTLERYADLLEVGVSSAYANGGGADPAALVYALMRDEAVVEIAIDRPGSPLLRYVAPAGRERGATHQAHRDLSLGDKGTVRVSVTLDEAPAMKVLRSRQVVSLAAVFTVLLVMMLLILYLLRTRFVRPLRALMAFCDRLSGGDFDTPLAAGGRNEIGRLGAQLESMRAAIKELFDDVQQREERFRSIVTQVPGAVFRFDPRGTVEFMSERVEAICGYPAARFAQHDASVWASLVYADDRARQRAAIDICMREHAPYHAEYRILHADGSLRWVAESGQPHIGADGCVAWVDGIVTDISQRKANETRIQALLAEQSAILDNVMFGVMFVRRRTIVSVNRRCEELFGYPVGSMLGQPTAVVFPDQESYLQAGERQYGALRSGRYLTEERQYRRADGSLFWCQLSGCAMRTEDPDDGSIWVFADMTERRAHEENLRLSAKVLDIIADGVIVSDPDGTALMVNPAFTRITGYEESEVIGRRPVVLESGREDAHAVWAELLATGSWQGEMWHKRKDGTPYLESLTMSAVRDRGGAVTQYVTVFSDITLVKEAQQKMDHLAHHDTLTGLPNRLLFNDRLAHALARAAREETQLALLFIDLDRFKHVNDTLGHHTGDDLLTQVAAGLSARLRDGDTLARLGGDEFILLLENVDGHYGTAVVADKLMQMFEQPFVVDTHELFVTCSVGVTMFPAD